MRMPGFFLAVAVTLTAGAPAGAEPGVAIPASPNGGWMPRDVDPQRFDGGLTRDSSVDPQRFGARLPDQAYGAFQRGLYITAYNLALPRARNGDPSAQTLVAEILSRGLGRARDEAAAATWYQAASEQGIAEAQFQYALLLLDGRFVKRDEKEAYALMQAAAEAGNRLAQFNLAQMIVRRESGDAGLRHAVDYYERAARAGLADAQYALAQIIANGAGGKAKDEAEARRLLLEAARQNFDTAQYDLGLWMVQGRGGKKSAPEGFGWLMRSARGGNVAAQNAVAKLYMQGIGVEPDGEAAAAWYILARRSGLHDPEMEDFFDGLTDAEIKAALARANRMR